MPNWVVRLAQRSPWLAARLRSVGVDPATHDWSGAKNFFLSLLLLGIALILALNGAAALERGRKDLMFVFHAAALLLTAYVAVKLVPRLAEGTPLRWIFYQVDYKFTAEGTVYLAVIFILVLAALNTGNNLLFIILASLMAGILVSGVVSRMVLTGVELRLELPEHIFARRAVLAALTLWNRKRQLPSFSLTVRGDIPKNGRKSRRERVPREGGTARRILAEPVYFPYVPGGTSTAQSVELVFPRRGRYQQRAFQLSTKFPFGFLLKMRDLPASHQLVVFPAVEPTEEFYEILPLLSGEMESFYRGRGHDLYSIRAYQSSDSARSVDWKATAKTQELKVREYTREDERRVELVFDPYLPPNAQTPAGEEQFEKAVSFCACLAWHFYEITAELQFRSPARTLGVARADQIIYDVLYELALIEPQRVEARLASEFLQGLSTPTGTFKVLLTAQPRGSIPTDLWTSSYVVFTQSL